MLAEEFRRQMEQLVEEFEGDTEALHSEMDNLMCKVLISLGYREGVKIFEDTDKWYS